MFDPGDIIHLDFDPAAGHEMKGPHFGLVISVKPFNKSGLAVICPITQGHQEYARASGLAVSLMGSGTEIQGVILCHMAKTLDLKARRARKKEKVPTEILNDVLDRYLSILALDD
jgi:mRNA interferase ChpB